MTQPSSYAYRAAKRDGALELGVIDASGREAASEQLAGRGLFPLEITLRRDTAERRRNRLPASELALGLRLLASLLEAGLPAGRALAAFEDLAPPSWKPGIPPIREAVREGRGLAGALRVSSLAMPPLVIGLVQAGEAGSGLAEAVRRAAEVTESAAATQAAIRDALAYPIILAVAGAASVALLVGVVLPRFAAVLADLGQALPRSTALVLGATELIRGGAAPALLACTAALVAWRSWSTSNSGRVQWHALLLSLPLIGGIRRSAATARVSASLAALLESGVPFSTALLHAARTADDAALAARLIAARESVTTGHRIAQALEVERALTPTAVRLVRAGEETGRLTSMLAHAARIERERAEQSVRQAVKLIEPALILLFGGLVALIAAALLQAIYGVRPV